MDSGETKILDYFEGLNTIPRCSGNEAGVQQWLISWAQQRGLEYQTDATGNLVVRVSATEGREADPVVVIQGHMDMVCEKTPESTHDFGKDPIVSHREGDWLTADDTTLGADNGIAIAYALALAEDESVDHPSLELLFTVDEETGLNGVKGLKSGFIKGRILINLDSEDEGIVTIGCAGGRDTVLTLNQDTAPVNERAHLYRLVVGGLKGGHSGIDIHRHRGNANKLLGRMLSEMIASAPVGLISIQGGTRKNAIPRDAQALLAIDPQDADEMDAAVSRFTATLQEEYAAVDAALIFEFSRDHGSRPPAEALTREAAAKVVDLLAALPNGVIGMSTTLDGLVETSCNLATVKLDAGKLTILSSQRSAVMSKLDAITAAVHAVGRLSGATIKNHDSYPSWQPDMDSAVLARSKEVYRRLYGQDLVLQVIHAGLECAVIGDIYPGTDMISFGPTIRDPHSPNEKIHVPSVAKVWEFLKELLKEMSV